MELIYADKDRNDIGILHDYDFDLAYGVDENNFELTIDLKLNCCEDDYLVYMVDTQHGFEEPTEYGGIIDTIMVDTSKNTVTYSGRTWHGILGTKVIKPEPGQDYKIVKGDAHEIMRGLISDAELSDLFEVEAQNSVITVPQYQFKRYTDLYTGLSTMLAENGGKLLTRYDNKKVVLTAVWLIDYSQDEEWDSSQVDFKIEKLINPVNHLVCLGQGDLKDRHVIHLYTDENGGVQPYAEVENPVKDADYIFDNRNQVMFGLDEVEETYDYSSAETKENYVILEVQPDDWGENYASYFTSDSNGDFKEVKGVEQKTYTPHGSQPSDWTTAFSNYYTEDGKKVEGIPTETYIPLSGKPSDWDKNWGNYYVHFWDGVSYEWRKVDSVTGLNYKLQTRQPSDWKTNFGSYYKREAKYKVTKNSRGKIIKKVKIGMGYANVKKVKKGKKEVVPTWKKGKYYTGYNYSVAPEFTKGLPKYRLEKTSAAPQWQPGLYFSLTTAIVAPPWESDVYYQLHYDHYAELILYGIDHLKEEAEDGDSIKINLDLLGEYDVGDIVGANENVTGIAVWQPITKKIVNIKNNLRKISYEIGAKK